jgi:cycloeucalenol cycloisomerase
VLNPKNTAGFMSDFNAALAEAIPLIQRMLGVFVVFGITIYFLICGQTSISKGSGHYLPDKNNMAKREFEIFALKYTVIWIAIFGVVVAFELYKQFTSNTYMIFLVSVASPYLLQPFLYPMPSEKNLPLHMRYSFKANIWIAIFSFIGNYWYTHYFYSVLEALYDFPSLRLNNVPLCLYFATHFYFVTYHSFSNLLLRKIETSYVSGPWRTALFWMVIISFAYFTAFMETLTISSFEHYSFKKSRATIYYLGSAFYGIYFIVSYPMFYWLDEYIHKKLMKPHTLYQTVMEAFACGMIVLLFLDFARLYLGVKLIIPGLAFCENESLKQCIGL